MRRIGYIGNVGTGKSYIINTFLQKAILKSEAGFVKKEKGTLNCLTAYPVTVIHDEAVQLEKYEGNKLVKTYKGPAETKLILGRLKRKETDRRLIHYLLKCPLKKEYRRCIVTDGLFCDWAYAFTEDYLEYVTSTKHPLFKIDRLIYVTQFGTGAKLLNDADITNLKKLEEYLKLFDLNMNYLYNTTGLFPDDGDKENVKKLDDIKACLVEELDAQGFCSKRGISFFHRGVIH